MARIKIKDLLKDKKISKEELKRIKGGAYEVFIKLEPTPQGECQDKDHKSEIDLLSYPYPTR